MQHIYVTLAAALLATASYAQTATRGTVSARPVVPTGIRATAKLAHTPITVKNHVLSTESSSDDVITKQPEGTLKDHYYRSGKSFVDIMGSIADQTVDGFWGKIVESPDGKYVYIKDPINAYFSNTWVKTTRTTNDTLELQLPVHFCHESYSDGTEQDGYLYRLKAKKETDEYGTYTTFVPDDNQLAKFVFRNDTLYFVNTTRDSKMLGMCDESGQWYGYGDYVLQFDPFHQTPVAPKSTEGAKKVSIKYTESGQEYGKVLTAVEDGNDVYLAGLCPNKADAWIKGTKNGDKLTFESGQFMGIDTVTESYNFFEAIFHLPTYYDYGDGTGDYFDEPFIDDNIVFTRIDDGNGGYTYVADSTFYVNQGYHQANGVAIYDTPSFTPWEDKAYTPVNPSNYYFEPYTEDLGYGTYSFIVSEFATSGEVLDRSKLFYNVIIDGEPFTFSPEDYATLNEPMTDIPFEFSDLADFNNYAGVFNVNLYIEGFSKIGVQVIYKGGDTVTKSDVVYYTEDEDPESVHSAQASLAGAKSLGFTDLSGRSISKPSHGVFIQTLRLADGSVKSVKRVIK